MSKKVTVTVTEQTVVIPDEVNSLTTKSAKIRALAAMNWSRGQISKALGLRYQHVRNVLTTPLKKQA